MRWIIIIISILDHRGSRRPHAAIRGASSHEGDDGELVTSFLKHDASRVEMGEGLRSPTMRMFPVLAETETESFFCVSCHSSSYPPPIIAILTMLAYSLTKSRHRLLLPKIWSLCKSGGVVGPLPFSPQSTRFHRKRRRSAALPPSTRTNLLVVCQIPKYHTLLLLFEMNHLTFMSNQLVSIESSRDINIHNNGNSR